jgi:hypothetical protein
MRSDAVTANETDIILTLMVYVAVIVSRLPAFPVGGLAPHPAAAPRLRRPTEEAVLAEKRTTKRARRENKKVARVPSTA